MSCLMGRVVLWGARVSELEELGRSLARLGLQVRQVDSIEAVRAAIRNREADLVIAPLCGCFCQPLEMLDWLGQEPAAPPVLIVTGAVDIHLYLEAMRRGAFDCVGLPLNENEVERIVSQALQARHRQAAAGG